MKVLIQANKYQKLAAEISKYSFIKQGVKDVEIINLEEQKILVKNFGKKYLRNGKLTIYDPNDLQSFTLLRFIPTKFSIKDFCMIIDPDIFAYKNPMDEINKFLDNKIDIFCTEINNQLRSEVMILNLKNKIWNFDSMIEDLFNLKTDYSDLMHLNFVDKKKIKIISNKFNDHDNINIDTILLHTSNRLTQPWKEGLKINFNTYFSKKYILINYIKYFLGMKHDQRVTSSKFIKHPNKEVEIFVGSLFKEAYKTNFINIKKIKSAIKDKSISENFIKKLKIYF